MEDISDTDYTYAKRVCKDFETKHLGEYHDSYVQSDTLVLADIFNSFRDMCLEIYGLDPTLFFLHQDWHGKQPQKVQSKTRFITWY